MTRKGKFETTLLLSVREAARLLDLCEDTVYARAKCGDLPSIRVGHRRLVPRTQLEQWIHEQARKSAPEGVNTPSAH